MDYYRRLLERMDAVHSFSRGEQEKAGFRQKAGYDQRCLGRTLDPGDKVWVYAPTRKVGLSPKLATHWRGPGEVIDRITDVVYRVRFPGRQGLVVLHRNRMFEYHPKLAGRGADADPPIQPPVPPSPPRRARGRPRAQPRQVPATTPPPRAHGRGRGGRWTRGRRQHLSNPGGPTPSSVEGESPSAELEDLFDPSPSPAASVAGEGNDLQDVPLLPADYETDSARTTPAPSRGPSPGPSGRHATPPVSPRRHRDRTRRSPDRYSPGS